MKYLRTYNEAVAPTFRASSFMEMKEHIRDITQDLSDDGFTTTINLSSKTPMNFVNEFTVKIYKPTTTGNFGTYGTYFKWDDVKDRVAQIISSVNEETNNEFVFEIQANSHDSFQKYWNSLEELDKNLFRGGKILKELTQFKIRFINKVINSM